MLAPQAFLHPILNAVMEIVLIFLTAGATVAYMIHSKVKSNYTPIVLPLIVLLALAYPIYDEVSSRQTEKVGTQVVQDVSGKKDGHLHCQRFWNAFFDAKMSKKGYVDVSRPEQAVLKRQVCKDLNSWFNSDKKEANLKQITAVAVMIHESVHVTGEYNESNTECITHQEFVPTVIKFRVSETEANRMKEEYVEKVYKNMPSKYHHTC